MKDRHCNQAEHEFDEATNRLIQAAEALRALPSLEGAADMKQRFKWKSERAGAIKLMRSAYRAFNEKYNALEVCQETNRPL